MAADIIATNKPYRSQNNGLLSQSPMAGVINNKNNNNRSTGAGLNFFILTSFFATLVQCPIGYAIQGNKHA